jgi:hypothetical protein
LSETTPTSRTNATVATVAAWARGGALRKFSRATDRGSLAMTQARCTSTSTAAETPKKRCTSITLSMPNARFSERSLLGSTAAQTSTVSAKKPDTTASRDHIGSGGAVASHSSGGPATMAPSPVSHAVRSNPSFMAATVRAPAPEVAKLRTRGPLEHRARRAASNYPNAAGITLNAR